LRVRFRIRTIMIVIAVSAVMMGLYRSSPTIFNELLGVVAQLLGVVALFFLLLVSSLVLIPFIAVYDWFVRGRRRQFSIDQSPIPESRTDSKRGAGESAG
jgi:cellobiose-specific phosphotransferase system component IIC